MPEIGRITSWLEFDGWRYVTASSGLLHRVCWFHHATPEKIPSSDVNRHIKPQWQHMIFTALLRVPPSVQESARSGSVRPGTGLFRVAVLSLLLAQVGLAAAGNLDKPHVPPTDATVLEHLPSTSDPRVRQFDVLKRKREEKPGSLDQAVLLSHAYLDYGRDTGDARYLGRAQAVIAPWTSKQPAPVDALLV
jgi:hypothetical protein